MLHDEGYDKVEDRDLEDEDGPHKYNYEQMCKFLTILGFLP
jgi:hypothetical protein